MGQPGVLRIVSSCALFNLMYLGHWHFYEVINPHRSVLYFGRSHPELFGTYIYNRRESRMVLETQCERTVF
jgi:hypothetical protein